jgi:transposase
MDKNRIVTNERVADIPLLLARQKEMGISELINRHFVPHGHWQGARPGEITMVWLTFILSEGDHRLNYVADWFDKRTKTIRHYVNETLIKNDFRDDRLAIILRQLSDDEKWSAFETELNQRSIRVYDLNVERIRLDSTTASGHWQVSADGLFHYGHSKDHRPELAQLKVMLSTLDPLGMPLVTTVVSGNRADDPLYEPAIQAVRQSLKKRGLLYIGDVKMAALGTRAAIQSQEDYYLCPLSAVQLPRKQILELIKPVLQEPSLLTEVHRTQADGKTVHLATGFERGGPQTVQVEGETVTWNERQIIARSDKIAQSQTQSLQSRLARAQQEIATLNERKQGKPLLKTLLQYQMAVAKILEQRKVTGLFNLEYHPVVQQRDIRKYGTRPERIERIEEITVSATPDEVAIEALIQTLGWRVYATNAPETQLPLDKAIVAYREQYTAERAFGRLKGKPLSLTPMYLEKDDHATGLVRLLSIGLRTLSLLEFSVRRSLEQTKQAISGLYAGNPQRKTKLPSAERLLAAFKDIILTVIQEPDSISFYLTPLSDTQSRILALLGFDNNLYLSLVQPVFWKPPIHLHEP